jgi:hypothetical protein
VTTRYIVLVAAWAFVAFGGTCFGQGVQTAAISGVVSDEQGRPLSGVAITASSPALQGLRRAVTETDGSYSLRTLPPGDYAMTFELSGFATANRTSTVPIGLVAEQNVVLSATGIIQAPQPAAEVVSAPIRTPIGGAHFTYDEVDSLPMARTLSGLAELSPGLTDVTRNAGQVSISGAFAFDNIFMVNGVDIDDNLLGSPQNLFIEDALQETQVLIAGISAEYGRFSGGVVNAITRSGGNVVSGSLRGNLTDPSWSTETPFEKSNGTVRRNILNESYEATFGGPIMRDRFWFFGAGRWEDLAMAQSFAETGVANTQADRNRRGEIKLTGTVAQNHSIQGGYLNNHTENVGRPSFRSSIDPFTVGNRRLPNWSYFTNYRGVLGGNLLAEAQHSRREFGFSSLGGTSRNIVDSPFLTLSTGRHYNAQYFDATDPENRNNAQITGSLTYLMRAAGRHELKGGYEWFRSQRTGGNSQSSTNYVFDTDYVTGPTGKPLYDSSGHLIPLFVPIQTRIENWLPARGAVLNVDTHSFYSQDHWAIGNHWSADLGMRYERVRSQATGGIVGVDTDTIVPRLAAAYDVQGNGKYVAHVTYGHYAGRYNEAQIGANTNVGNPAATFGTYLGPAGQGRTFAPGFNPANYSIDGGIFPTANVMMAKGLSSPLTKELTVSFGSVAGRRGFVAGTYIFRRTSNIIEDFITLSNGRTRIVENGIDFGTFTNVVYDNTDLARREYRAVLFQTRYNLRDNWSVNGHYTLMLKNAGNYEGETSNRPVATSLIGDYPEAFNPARNFPEGWLQDYQRHKLRIWSSYQFNMDRAGDVSVSGMWRVNSGQVYSLRAQNEPMTQTQLAILRLAGYIDAPRSQDVYFGQRGSQRFPGYGLFDISLNYNITALQSIRPWAKVELFNVFDNLKLIAWNRTVRSDPASPKDSLGLATGYLKDNRFGQADSNTDFPAPLPGVAGGRTFRLAFGVRF